MEPAPAAIAAVPSVATGASKPTKRVTSSLDTRGCSDLVTFDFEEFVKSKLNLNVEHTP
ncbi:hypothetical protein IWW57_000817, partial [Coemansia sp. S610]